MGVLGIQDIRHFTSRNIGYYLIYFQGYGIMCSLFCLLSDIGYLRKLIMGVYKGYLTVYFKGYGIIGTPYISLIYFIV